MMIWRSRSRTKKAIISSKVAGVDHSPTICINLLLASPSQTYLWIWPMALPPSKASYGKTILAFSLLILAQSLKTLLMQLTCLILSTQMLLRKLNCYKKNLTISPEIIGVPTLSSWLSMRVTDSGSILMESLDWLLKQVLWTVIKTTFGSFTMRELSQNQFCLLVWLQVKWVTNLMLYLEDSTHPRSSLVKLVCKLLAIVQVQASQLLDHGLWRQRIFSTGTTHYNTLGRLGHSQQLLIPALVLSQFLQKNTICCRTCGRKMSKTLIATLMPPSASLSRPVTKLRQWSSQWASKLERQSLSSPHRATCIKEKTSASSLSPKTHLILLTMETFCLEAYSWSIFIPFMIMRARLYLLE